ncbi:hypothetical protein BGHDH14_bgh01202 [Blumeria hordei DH14]|uniref:GAT domain-containing protein n=1 Tax=Blumeria graminis f. sp. hordei (strain DH14) TaxID=546991 RepID=N1J7N5_BLUG1|nr:hypothetical protein BGHDH14_bgh01202 [Blumeria hordei DH14]
MRAMKAINMNRVMDSLKRKTTSTSHPIDLGEDTPEAIAIHNIILFCESSGPDGVGDEFLYLPNIVDACESSPLAAKEAAHLIRKFLTRDYSNKPHFQFSSIMLIRILVDNPGHTFTRNIDAKFVQTLKILLRTTGDPNVVHILSETLNKFEREKIDDENLELLIEMWKKEQGKLIRRQASKQDSFSRNHHDTGLPPIQELSARIEEARTSATLLTQVVRTVSSAEILSDELARELAEGCQSASRSIQAYIAAVNPAPDNATMETLIEVNELLSKSLSLYQRGILNARKYQEIRPFTPTGHETTSKDSIKSSLSTPENPFADVNEEKTKHNEEIIPSGSAINIEKPGDFSGYHKSPEKRYNSHEQKGDHSIMKDSLPDETKDHASNQMPKRPVYRY